MKIPLLTVLTGIQFCLAQPNNIAVITNPQIGPESNALNLIEVVEDINGRQHISQVVVLGNITDSGKFDEFIWAQEILDELTVPYFVVGGENDYALSEGKGSEINLLWEDDKHFFMDNSFTAVGFSTFLYDYPNKKYINSETMSWLENALEKENTGCILTFSYYPIQSAENSYQYFEKTLGKKLFSMIGREDKTAKGQSTFEGLYLNRKNGWGYLLISTKQDSILIKKILCDEIKNKSNPEIVKTVFKKSLLLESNKQHVFTQSKNNLWTVRVKKTKRTPPVYTNGKIFSVFDRGLIICINELGKELWRTETNKRISTPPLLTNGLLVIASDDGDILTYDVSTGNQNQTIGIGEKISSDISLLNIDDHGNLTNAVIAGTAYGNLYCYDLYYLDPIWTEQLNTSDSNLRVVSSIVSSNNQLFFYDSEETLYCMTSKSGMLIWTIQSSGGGWKINNNGSGRQKKNISFINNDLYLIDGSGSLFCVDPLLGLPKWDVKNINANGLIRIDSKGLLVLPTTNNKLIFISPKTRKVSGEIELPIETKDESINDILLIGNQILVGFSDGWVFSINPKQKIEKLFRISSAPIVSLQNINGSCLVTDIDGNFTLLTISSK